MTSKSKLVGCAAGLAVLAMTLLPTALAHNDTKPDAGQETLIHAGTVMAVPGQRTLTGVTIVVKDGKIAEIIDGYILRDGATIIDLKDDYVLPGLIDSHVHLSSEWNPNARLDGVTKESGDTAFDSAINARKTLMAGFTAVQDVGGPPEIFALRRAVNSGKMVGPHIRASGSAVSITGGHGDAHGYLVSITDMMRPETVCDGPDDCRRAARLAVKRGADVIKITATGGVLSNTNAGTEQQFFNDELDAIVEAAEKMGRKVTAHAHGKTGIESALKAGVKSIEHGTYLDDETVRLFKQYNAVLVPTVLAGMTVVDWAENTDWLPPNSRQKALEVGPQMQDMLRTAYEGGVKIAFGTDTGVSAHGDNAQEFVYMVAAGMSGEEAIRAATVTASRHIEMGDKIGTLEPGKHADIIAVNGDPRVDISELQDVDFVMKGGEVYKHEE
ncbi:metal-dependent hydrolase family protein [Robiginitomaculum antarcticum]|uniref:metal-dependent hydrolase family protein n=1 Tax=Robiginitomaculum antarcticum TaxID=437507 RepID=UPI00035FA1FB|nr:amidohydrolase family protein [Robiginitomaculum antarcticum]